MALTPDAALGQLAEKTYSAQRDEMQAAFAAIADALTATPLIRFLYLEGSDQGDWLVHYCARQAADVVDVFDLGTALESELVAFTSHLYTNIDGALLMPVDDVPGLSYDVFAPAITLRRYRLDLEVLRASDYYAEGAAMLEGVHA